MTASEIARSISVIILWFELPELKGFSERNIKRMLTFHRAYPAPDEFMPQAAAQISAREKSTPLVAKEGASEKVPQAPGSGR